MDGQLHRHHFEGMTIITLCVDYRPVMDQWYTVRLELPDEAGDSEQVCTHVREALQRDGFVELEDAAGELWSFEGGTVNRFWTQEPPNHEPNR